MSEYSQLLTTRYRPGYSAAKGLVVLGRVLKIAAFVVPAVIAVAQVYWVSYATVYIPSILYLFPILYAVVATAIVFAAGMIVTALGHGLRAIIDTSVHSAPLLTQEEKADIIDRNA